MKNFAKSILNYFAAYTETRFRFSRKLQYLWSNDSFTLDLSVFPAFQKELLDSVATGTPFKLEIRSGEHAVRLDPDTFKESLLAVFDSKLNPAFLQACVDQARKRLEEASPDEDKSILTAKALSEGLREFNLEVRRQSLTTLTELQEKKIRELQAQFGFSNIPPSSFNPQREVQRIFDDLQRIVTSQTAYEGYYTAVISYLENQTFNFVMFDLLLVLRHYSQLVGMRSLYVYFHEISKEDQKYPLFSVEVDLRDCDHYIRLESIRNVIMLNTPAINSFEFDTVLTTPRACRFEDGAGELSVIERFLQAKFNVGESFILKPHFRPLIRDGMPTVAYRLGLQALKEEDRRILDYSELITSLDQGAGRKFIDIISQYVEGNVENTSDQVHETYMRDYPRKSAERLSPKRLLIPLSLNETQKKILIALENERNRIIVVDGPPGTGKSYTITAIVYLANQLGRSVVITSHKKQALDVIDQALTDQFKKLHPRSKPPVLRLESGRGPLSPNNIDNSLSGPVINAARSRSHEVNAEAITIDRDRFYEQIEKANLNFWKNTSEYHDFVRKTFEWIREGEAVCGAGQDLSEITPCRLTPGISIDLNRVRRVTSQLSNTPINVSMDALALIFKDRDRLPGILKKCDDLNQISAKIPTDIATKVQSVPTEISNFNELADRLSQCVEENVPIRDFAIERVKLSPPNGLLALGTAFQDFKDIQGVRGKLSRLVDLEGKFMGKILKSRDITQLKQEIERDHPRVMEWVEREGAKTVLGNVDRAIRYVIDTHRSHSFLTRGYVLKGYRQCSPEALKDLLLKLNSLEFSAIINLIANLSGKPFPDATLAEIKAKLELIHTLRRYLELRHDVQTFAEHVRVSLEDLPKLYATLKQVQEFLKAVESEDIRALASLFQYYGRLLEVARLDSSDLSSLGWLGSDPDRSEHLFRFIQLHGELSSYPLVNPPARDQLDEFFAKTQKLLNHRMDHRLSNLLKRTADIQRIQTSVAAGKRITSEQTRVLLDNLSCIISEPDLISEHFPMESDIIDILVIDEASQVSIAESISLMLRAKQTIVFGDELQYGAVGAITVSERYSADYFKDILHDYALDRNQAISDEEKDRIAQEVSATPTEEEQESSRLIPIEPGTREWLKTFSVRTSTLAFAKALRNYSESLKVHFRSFPEIISYSNEKFYKESQIELIPNRIRTKPIKEVLRFIKVDTKGKSGANVNLDEIEAIQGDIEDVVGNGYKGTIGVICSFKEQTDRMSEIFRKEMKLNATLERNHNFKIWFVGDVQGEERDLIYYSFVQDKGLDNADLRTIYPVIGGTADNIRRLKMQRLNVGFSRAKDIMVLVHSMPLKDYSDTRLGDALDHYEKVLSSAQDHYVEDEKVFGSPAEMELYGLMIQTRFFQENRDKLRLIAQFEIGKYIREEYHRNIPKYRVDFLLTKSDGGKEKSLIVEYDGVEFHTKNPDVVTKHNFDQEYLEYDAERQLELESYGYSFLRINKFSLIPTAEFPTRVDVLNNLLDRSFSA